MVVKILSYGGGVQSTAMILKVLDGELERPDHIVFADTGSEMPHTMITVAEIEKLVRKAKIPFTTVGRDEGLHETYATNNSLPVVGIRSCTSKWKIEPMKRYMRSIVGMGRGSVLCEVWIGISTDEMKRATPSTDKWTTRRYPLLELNMSRDDCLFYLNKQGWKVQKSGCFMCPYQSAAQWTRLKRDHPDLFAQALSMEKNAKDKRGFRGGLWGSTRSIEAFNFDSTLEDFGFDMGVHAECCAVEGGCFL